MTLRRSARNVGKTFDYTDSSSIFPEGPPGNELERLIERLNKQAFASSSYAQVDDILVYSLFATKHRAGNHRALVPLTAGDGPWMTRKEALSIANIIRLAISPDHPTEAECNAAAIQLWHEHRGLVAKEDLGIVEQQVISNCDLRKT
jgi:hypothetical protein